MATDSYITVIISFRSNIIYLYRFWFSLNWSILYTDGPGGNNRSLTEVTSSINTQSSTIHITWYHKVSPRCYYCFLHLRHMFLSIPSNSEIRAVLWFCKATKITYLIDIPSWKLRNFYLYNVFIDLKYWVNEVLVLNVGLKTAQSDLESTSFQEAVRI